eukprot:11384561-Alexandrium_andersonii.AAC.1
MQHRFRRSNLELRRPRSGLKIGPRRSRQVCSAQCFAQIPNAQAKWVIEGVEVAAKSRARKPQSAIRHSEIRAIFCS